MMKKTFKFYNKWHRADIDIELIFGDGTNRKTIDLKPIYHKFYILSICGNLYKNNGLISCGQNLEEILEIFSDDELVQKLFHLWKEYHLNDLNPGTRAQQERIDSYKRNHPDWNYDYTEALEVLKRFYLDEDRVYVYGSNWLVKLIPDEIVSEIKNIIER
jgi:hypothetical protein